MSESIVARLRDWGEPAHPGIIRLHGDLIQVYRAMREQQAEIDAAFDRATAQIGFVVTTTLPVQVEVASEGKVKSAQFAGEALRGTIFEKELGPFLQGLTAKAFTSVSAGTYYFYLIWYNALTLKLSYDYLEWAPFGPPHTIAAQPAERRANVAWEVREPPHWFDPGYAIAVEDAVVISAVDTVYPELKLSERIAADRLAIRRVRPEVIEPPASTIESALLRELKAKLGKT